MSKNRRIWKTTGILLTFFLSGMMNTVLAPVIPLMKTRLNVSLVGLGLAATIVSGARLIAVIPAGIIADNRSRANVLRLGTTAILLGAAIIGFVPYGITFYLCMILFGIGHAFMDGAANGMMIDLYPEKPGGVLNLLHMSFGAGGMIGPLVYGLLIQKYDNWKFPFLFIAFVGIFVLAVIMILKFDQIHTVKNKSAAVRKRGIDGIIIYLCFMMLIMVGSTNAFKTWINTFMEYKFAVTSLVASSVLAFSNGGVMLGRFICSIISEKAGYDRILIIGMCGTCVAGFITLFARNPIVSMVAFIFAGMFMSPFFPITIALAGKMYPNKKGMLAGLFTAFASSGSMLFPVFCGYVADITSDIKKGLLILPLVPIIPISIFLVWARKHLSGKNNVEAM